MCRNHDHDKNEWMHNCRYTANANARPRLRPVIAGHDTTGPSPPPTHRRRQIATECSAHKRDAMSQSVRRPAPARHRAEASPGGSTKEYTHWRAPMDARTAVRCAPPPTCSCPDHLYPEDNTWPKGKCTRRCCRRFSFSYEIRRDLCRAAVEHGHTSRAPRAGRRVRR